MRRLLLGAFMALAGCYSGPPCYLFDEAYVPYNPASVRLRVIGLGQQNNGPIFADAEQALRFARDARMVLCAVEPEPYDAGEPDAGPVLFFRTFVVQPDGGTRVMRVEAQ